MKQLLVLGPKGGAGKTTTARNMAVAAVLSGLRVAVLDADRQRTLSRWLERRPDTLPSIQSFEVPMRDIDSAPDPIEDVDLLIVDTPASVEDHPGALKSLIEAADLILLPSGVRGEEMDSLKETLKAVRPFARPMVVLLNGVKPKQVETSAAYRGLAVGVTVAPALIPDLAEVHRTYDVGIGVVELRGAKTADMWWENWRFIADVLGVKQ